MARPAGIHPADRVWIVATDLALAASLVREAGQLAAAMRRDGLVTKTKTSVSDVVTAADHAAEELIVTRLRAERPEDGLVGEEGTDEPGARTWFIDPVDGTYNFAFGLPIWCSALGLADSGGAVLGAIYQPVTDELWLGGRDDPTTCNGVPVAPDTRALAEVSVATYLHPDTLPDDRVRLPLLRAIRRAATVRMMGSGSVELAAVASGRLGCFVQYDCLPWDWLPGSALVTAAGGTVRIVELDGHRWHLAGSAGVVEEVSALLLGAD
jgi:myo-inositol-1(or 4)-monophosphatase